MELLELVAELEASAGKNFIVKNYGEGIGKSVQDCSQSSGGVLISLSKSL
jgi:hypothetical protein